MDLMEIEVNRLEMLDYRLVMLVNKMGLLGLKEKREIYET